ncbi:hypothetical protein QP028_15555 [Corynebacterium suedekumii]|nr:hypothetical protein QP028_15555 [Corynebacterium suedekumii]
MVRPASPAPSLLLSTRPEDEAAAAELVSFREKMGLSDDQLIQHRLEATPLGDLDLDDYSGILLGGSPFNASDPHKSDLQLRVEADLARLMAEVLDRDFPLFGACYGVGTVGTAIGATIDETYGEKPRVIGVTRAEEAAHEPILEGMPERFSTMVGHKEAIRVLPRRRRGPRPRRPLPHPDVPLRRQCLRHPVPPRTRPRSLRPAPADLRRRRLLPARRARRHPRHHGRRRPHRRRPDPPQLRPDLRALILQLIHLELGRPKIKPGFLP